MVSEGLRYKPYAWSRGQACQAKKEDAGLAQGEPPGGVGQGSLASQLT